MFKKILELPCRWDTVATGMRGSTIFEFCPIGVGLDN